MSHRPICEMCGRSSEVDAAVCNYCGIPFPAPIETEQGLADPPMGSNTEPSFANPSPSNFNFRAADTGTVAFAKAEAAFLSSLFNVDRVSELGYRRDAVQENEDAFYFPVGWIGCVGHLVSKATYKVISFGSYISPGAHIWAYYEGISMEPLGKDRRNKLRILSVKDVQNTVEVLKAFLHPKYVREGLMPKLTDLPIEIEDVDLYFGIWGLLEARAKDWFAFEVSQ